MVQKMILNVVGARPNFMKIAPLVSEMRKAGIAQKLVHTGQHYDANMNDVFFKDLQMPAPDVFLGVGSGSHSEQTAKVMVEFEHVVLKEKPSLVVVVGDVNSTLACALVAVKLHVSVAHVEAGLRSRDWAMPEEVNRVLTDRISDLLFTPSKDADENLAKEGLTRGVHFVGNIMIDSLKQNLEKARARKAIAKGEYCLITMHRPENVDNAVSLEKLVSVINTASKKIHCVFPIHPRTRKMLDSTGLGKKLSNVTLVEPVGYLDFLKLQMDAKFVLTDSGGIQEETTFLGVPCLTVRKNTERPITVSEGTNTVVGLNEKKVTAEIEKIYSGKYKKGKIPEKWDGKTAERICAILKSFQ